MSHGNGSPPSPPSPPLPSPQLPSTHSLTYSLTPFSLLPTPYLPTYLPTCLPACLPTYLPTRAFNHWLAPSQLTHSIVHFENGGVASEEAALCQRARARTRAHYTDCWMVPSKKWSTDCWMVPSKKWSTDCWMVPSKKWSTDCWMVPSKKWPPTDWQRHDCSGGYQVVGAVLQDAKWSEPCSL